MPAHRIHAATTALVIALAAAGCSSTPLTVASQTGCTETLSGAVTGAFGCPSAATAWDASSNITFLRIAATDSSALNVAIPITGEPRLGNYTLADQGTLLGGISLREGLWFAGQTFVPSGYVSVAGGYTLTLTSASVASTADTGKTYIVHGALDATLAQECPAVAVCPPVAVRAVF